MQLQPYSTGRFSAHLTQSHQAFCDAMLECCGQSQLLQAGEDLLSQGRELTHMCLVPEGRVSMNICAVNGRRFQLGELDCDWHLFGEMEFFTATSCQWSVVAEEPMEIRQLCLKKVRQMLLQQPEFTLFFASALAWDYQDSLDIYTNRLLHPISYNIAFELLRRQHEEVMLGSCGSPDQEAERFGTSGRVYRRAVKELIDKGLVIKQGALLKIANLQALQDFVDKA